MSIAKDGTLKLHISRAPMIPLAVLRLYGSFISVFHSGQFRIAESRTMSCALPVSTSQGRANGNPGHAVSAVHVTGFSSVAVTCCATTGTCGPMCKSETWR
jgi:hypothetical protein